MIALTVFRC